MLPEMSINPRHAANGRPLKAPKHKTGVLHDDSGFDADERAALILGVWVHCWSSWISRAKWDEGSEELTVETYREDGSTHQYTWRGVGYDMAEAFAAAPSKGNWVNRHLLSRG